MCSLYYKGWRGTKEGEKVKYLRVFTGTGTGGSGNGAGPVSFANLRQMAGLPGSAAGGGSTGSGDGNGKKKRKAAPTLVSRLKSQGSFSLHESQESLNAVSAVCMNIAQGPANKRRR